MGQSWQNEPIDLSTNQVHYQQVARFASNTDGFSVSKPKYREDCPTLSNFSLGATLRDRARRLINNIQQLPQNVYSRLTLENDEYTYSSQAIADICQAAKVPMVFDAHHHLVYEHLDSYDHPSVSEKLEIARTTWEQPQWQLVHISNGREHLHDNKHSDLITNMPASFRNVPWIEIEAKLKEQAISKLRKEWLRSPNLQQLTRHYF